MMVGGLFISLELFAQQSSEKPNFVVIVTDDQAYRAIGYNNPDVLTPHLDALASKGLVFDFAFTASPVCVASRASMLTGLYPQTNGTVALDSKSFVQNVVVEKKFETLAQLLRKAGYFTYFSGKSHLGNPLDYGFQQGEETFGHDDEDAFNQAQKFLIDSPVDRPFLLWLAPRQPHLPLLPAQEWLDLYPLGKIKLDKNFRKYPLKGSLFNQGLPGERLYRDTDYKHNVDSLSSGPPRSKRTMKKFIQAYYATISKLDDQIGKLVSVLDSGRQLENTVFIFLSDNGYFLGNHGLGNKLTMHEESVRVPFFMYWNIPLMQRGRTPALVSTVDLMPTILDIAGVRPPDHLQGVSLKKILLGQAGSAGEYVVSESVGVGGQLGLGHRMVRTKQWKYILSDENEEALFDLNKDPFELKNLINRKSYAPQLVQLRIYYCRWREYVRDKKQLPPC